MNKHITQCTISINKACAAGASPAIFSQKKHITALQSLWIGFKVKCDGSESNQSAIPGPQEVQAPLSTAILHNNLLIAISEFRLITSILHDHTNIAQFQPPS
jgi:hypothetical protein